jgi:hypothetical protein
VTGVETTAERVVIRDVFPAVVRAGGQTWRNARAVITRDRVYVWTSRTTAVIDAAYDPELSTVPALNASRSARTALVLTAEPVNTMRAELVQHLTVEGQRGCGCGNPLKGWTPWRPYRKATR